MITGPINFRVIFAFLGGVIDIPLAGGFKV
jgi:hypothetical protein